MTGQKKKQGKLTYLGFKTEAEITAKGLSIGINLESNRPSEQDSKKEKNSPPKE